MRGARGGTLHAHGIAAAMISRMGSQDPRVPKSYDDIVRETVPDPDSSQRPSERQEQQAREGFRAMDDDESALTKRVQSSVDPGVEVEVARDTVTLRGQVRDMAAIDRNEDAVKRVDGVRAVVNRLVVAS